MAPPPEGRPDEAQRISRELAEEARALGAAIREPEMDWRRGLTRHPWLFHGALAMLTLALGYSIGEIRRSRFEDDSRLERAVQQDIPTLNAKVSVHEVQIAALDGTQRRLEAKVDSLRDGQDRMLQAIVRLEAQMSRVEKAVR